MNVVALVGRLTRDPELRYTNSGVATCSFTLAVDDPFAKGEKKADFLNIVAWKQTAEACANYLRKGRLCSVEGRISTRNYENKEGQKVYVTEIVTNSVRFLEKPEGSQSKPQESAQNNGNPVDISDDDLPF
jgi:single-strand DNA-binding protein